MAPAPSFGDWLARAKRYFAGCGEAGAIFIYCHRGRHRSVSAALLLENIIREEDASVGPVISVCCGLGPETLAGVRLGCSSFEVAGGAECLGALQAHGADGRVGGERGFGGRRVDGRQQRALGVE